MEHSHVIRKIDLLAESYNWESVAESPYDLKAPLFIKEIIRTDNPEQHKKLLWSLFYCTTNEFRTISEKTVVMTQLLIKLLEYRQLRNKTWVFKALDRVSLPHNFHHLPAQKTYRVIQGSLPLLQGFLNSHQSEYRIYAARILKKLAYQSQEIITMLLDRLQRERSPLVVCHLLLSLRKLILYRDGRLVSGDLCVKLLAYAETLLSSRVPLVGLAAGTLCLQLLRAQPSPHILDLICKSWSAIRSDYRHWTANKVLSKLIEQVQWLPDHVAYPLLARLVKHSKTRITRTYVWDYIRRLGLAGTKHSQPIAFTNPQKHLLETLANHQDKWSWRGRRIAWLIMETTQSNLQSQLRYARIVDERPELAPDSSLPLYFDSDVVRVR